MKGGEKWEWWIFEDFGWEIAAGKKCLIWFLCRFRGSTCFGGERAADMAGELVLKEMSVCMWMDTPVILHARSLYLRKTFRRTDM